MKNNKTGKNQTKHYVKIKSKVHPSIYHVVEVDLRCYERMPDEKKLCKLGISLSKRKEIEKNEHKKN